MAATLTGLRIIELAGVEPVAFAGMMLADHGAAVISVVRPGDDRWADRTDPFRRSREIVQIDLKHPGGQALLRDMCREADGLIEGSRPGVLERLGLAPDILLGDNPKLVIGRATGWGQTGPRAADPGHDINFVATSGLLHASYGGSAPSLVPLNIAGMLLAFGMAAALLNATRSGLGQVVDCATVDGAALLAAKMSALESQGGWSDRRGDNPLDGAAPYYESYQASDGLWLALGAYEPPFYRRLLEGLGLAADPACARQYDETLWPGLKRRLVNLFKTRPRAYWLGLFAPGDTCLSPVHGLGAAADDPHNKARGLFLELDGVRHAAPAPRFSRTPAPLPVVVGGTRSPSADDILVRFGVAPATVAALIADAIVA